MQKSNQLKVKNVLLFICILNEIINTRGGSILINEVIAISVLIRLLC